MRVHWRFFYILLNTYPRSLYIVIHVGVHDRADTYQSDSPDQTVQCLLDESPGAQVEEHVHHVASGHRMRVRGRKHQVVHVVHARQLLVQFFQHL